MASYRLTQTARSDIVAILAWSEDQFGVDARERYETLIATAIRDAGALAEDSARTPRPELGDRVFSWHLSQSRAHAPGKPVRRPRHFLICRRDGDILVIARVLHDSMDLRRHVDPEQSWE